MIARTKYGSMLKMTDGSFIGRLVEDGHVWEAEETEAVMELVAPGDRCIDVGAHVGYYTGLMVSLGASVLAFEPNPKLYSMLVDNIVNNNLEERVQAFNLAAISSLDRTASFHLPSDFDDGWGSLCHSDLGDKAIVVTVAALRLDDVLPVGRFKLLKTDTEGAEELVLRGLGGRIHDIDYILVEMNDSHFKYFDTSTESVDAYLRDSGFALVRSFQGNMNSLYQNEAAR